MALRVVVFDDHTGDPTDLTPDQTTMVQVDDTVWETYMAPETVKKLTEMIYEFFAKGEPPTTTAMLTMTRTSSRKDEGAYPEGIYPHSPVSDPPRRRATSKERWAQRQRIRTWASQHESPYLARQVIGDKGRIPSSITAAYYEAHPDEAKLFLT